MNFSKKARTIAAGAMLFVSGTVSGQEVVDCKRVPEDPTTKEYAGLVQNCIPELRVQDAWPGGGTVFVLPDTHGSPEVEQRKIELLQKHFGLNLVAVEGWAGRKADEERGFRALNAEEGLIEWLLSKPEQYRTLPLEDAELQRIQMAFMVYDWTSAMMKQIQSAREGEEVLSSARALLSGDLSEQERTEISNLAKDTRRIVTRAQSEAINTKMNIDEVLSSFFPGEDLEAIYREGLEYEQGFSEGTTELQVSGTNRNAAELIPRIRSAKAVRLLLKQLYPQEDVTMVFGEGHIEDIVAFLRKEGRGVLLLER